METFHQERWWQRIAPWCAGLSSLALGLGFVLGRSVHPPEAIPASPPTTLHRRELPPPPVMMPQRPMPHIEDTAVTAILLLGKEDAATQPRLPMMPRFTILLARGSCRHPFSEC